MVDWPADSARTERPGDDLTPTSLNSLTAADGIVQKANAYTVTLGKEYTRAKLNSHVK
jgi:hypothetical protein